MTARLECAEKTVQDQHSKLNEYQIREEDYTDQTRQNIQSFTQMVKYQENRYIKSNCIDLSQRITWSVVILFFYLAIHGLNRMWLWQVNKIQP